MPTFHVTMRRTELITFSLIANDAEQAADEALMFGDEIGSELVAQPTVVEVVEITETESR